MTDNTMRGPGDISWDPIGFTESKARNNNFVTLLVCAYQKVKIKTPFSINLWLNKASRVATESHN